MARRRAVLPELAAGKLDILLDVVQPLTEGESVPGEPQMCLQALGRA
ncbi:hypothetical protein [Pseudomonas sp. TMP9]